MTLSNTSLVIAEQPDKIAVLKILSNQLQRLSKLYQLPNWSEDNSVILAEWITDNYKYDSLDDVIACLANPPQTYDERGAIESNWRLTPDRIQKWMSVQLEKSAIAREKEHQNNKNNPLEILSDDQIKSLQEVILNAEGVKKVVPITESEIKKEGQEKPIKPVYKPTDASYLRMVELKAEYGRTHCDLHTGKKIPSSPDFDTWLNEK